MEAVLKDMVGKAREEGGFKAALWNLIADGSGVFSEKDEEKRKSKESVNIEQRS